jgi:succinyl-diaminopimelate desuccinylase
MPGSAVLMEEMFASLAPEMRRVVVPQRLWHVPGGGAEGERVNLIARRRGGRPVLGLYFHTDTVPPAAGWGRDPFTMVCDGSG